MRLYRWVASTVCALGVFTLSAEIAWAHAHLTDPLPRFDTMNPAGGIKEAAAPCGMAKPATAPHVYVMGSTITVKIGEVIDHPGHYELWWSNANDANFAVITGMNNIANPTGLVDTSVSLTLPNTAMDNATLQLRMIMTNTNPPTNYYSCADIKLVAPTADLAGAMSNDMLDLAYPEGTDLSTAPDTDDNADFSTDDVGVGGDVDMGHKPGADKAGIAGCAVGGSGDSALLLTVLLGLMFGLTIVPSLRRRYR